ncbi:guanylate kinase [bacterium]|jgi:guanylate kinase|nr:guanylate kinase [Verrucomicrobiota bacterium]MDA7633405.1 guanylate kinase [bacterium]MDA7644768.1 guanylate kinase [bacterium]
MSGRTSGVLFLISAPSGAGKTTVCQNLLAANSDLVRAITCTTRPARDGEVNGRDYYFLDETEFISKIEGDAFLEHAVVYGNRYGTLKSEVQRLLESGKNILLNIDVQGAALLRRRAESDPLIRDSLVTVFLTPASWEELERRLRSRATDSETIILKRLRAAAVELGASEAFDYLVLSETMDEDRRRMETILEGESMRRSRNQLPEVLCEAAEKWGTK